MASEPRPVELIAVPYDSGHRGLRMGGGPLDLLAHGAAIRAGLGGESRVEVVEAEGSWRAEVATAFGLSRVLSGRVAETSARGAIPLVLAGNCSTAVGTVSGLHAAGDDVGVLWLDAHADLNTPETSTSGFLDGMALAILIGDCWGPMSASVPGFRPLPPARGALVGARDLDPPEAARLASAGIGRVTVAEVARDVGEAIGGVVDRMRAAGARRLYLHLDLDVHDPAACRANPFAAPDGLSAEQVHAVIAAAAERIPIAAAAITAYDPAFAGDGRAREVALALVDRLAGLKPLGA